MSATEQTTTQGISETASRIRLAVTRTARRMRQQANSDLGPAGLSALATIERHGPLTPSELAKIERVQRPTATRLLSGLTEKELVSRAADPSDKRCSIVSITPQGKAMLKRIRGRKNAWLARRMKELPDDEVAALERAAEILERVLEEDRR
jgi:DNA-binding MarR family transcriptional regulator